MFTDEVKISKGMLLLIAACVVILDFVVLFAALLFVGDTKQVELNAVQLIEMRQDVNALSTKLDELNKTLTNQAIKDAEIKGRDFGYRMGRTDKEQGH